MKRISSSSLAWSAILLAIFVGAARATPNINGATIVTRTFNDCSISTLSVTNNYPASISITDTMDPACVGFANLHSFSFSADGGATAAVFNNNSDFHFGADFKIDGAGEGEGGLRLSPWYGQYVDGRFMANATTGEIACFGGAIPFYSFTVNHGITYTRGTTIHLELTYRANDLDATHPASIQYRVVYNGNTYDSPVLSFGEQNEAECVHGLWGMLNDGRAGGYFQPRANTGAALTATWSNIKFSCCLNTVEINVRPLVLNTSSSGKYVTVSIEPTPPASPSDIDVSSILLNGTVAVAPGAPVTIGDFDGDGIPDLTVRFNRSDVKAILGTGGVVPITITGVIAGDCFTGTQGIKVLGSPLSAPAAGSVLQAGDRVDLAWRPEAGVQSVSVISSFDNGSTWRIEAENLPDNGGYGWTVPTVASTDQARVAVVQIHSVDETGYVTEAEIGESGRFTIQSVLGVEDGPASFGLRGITPNPARGAFSVLFSLPGFQPATLAVYDVGGRRVAERSVGTLGAGLHAIVLGERGTLHAGLYIVRLSQAGRVVTGRVAVVP